MGDPKRSRKTYHGPSHPWQKSRIDEEAVYMKEFGMKNKKEIWRIQTLLKKFKEQTKKLIPLNTPQAKKEEMELLTKVKSLGLLPETGRVEEVLGISLHDVLSRRLQSIVFKKGLSRTSKQARQFIVHQHIAIGNKLMTSPNYIVSLTEEGMISFVGKSPFSNSAHPELIQEEPKAKPKEVPKENSEEDLPGEIKKEELKEFEVE